MGVTATEIAAVRLEENLGGFFFVSSYVIRGKMQVKQSRAVAAESREYGEEIDGYMLL